MIIGHSEILKILERLFQKKSVPHAFFFWGPEQLGKKTVARLFAQTLLCDNKKFLGCGECDMCNPHNPFLSELIISIGEKINEEASSVMGIEEIREIQTLLDQTNFLNKPRIIICENVALLTDEAAHAFLKTLEEPPKNTYIILLGISKDALLPTLFSRTVPIRFSRVAPFVLETYLTSVNTVPPDTIGSLARFAEGKPGKLLQALKSPEIIKIAQERYSTAILFLTSPLYVSLQKTEELLKMENQIEAYLPFLFSVMRSLILAQKNLEGAFAFTLSSKIQKKLLHHFLGKNISKIFTAFFKTHWLLRFTRVNPRLAFEAMLLEI